MKRYVYKNRLTGHWIVDVHPRHEGNVLVVNPHRQGYRRWLADGENDGALTEAVRWADEQRARHTAERARNRALDDMEAEFLAMLPAAEGE